MPLDDRGEWYRFHHLFAQLLRVELEHREPGLTPTLHRRALRVASRPRLGRRGDRARARGRRVRRGRRADRGRLDRLCQRGRHATVLAWLERLSREAERGRPRSCSSRPGCSRCAGSERRRPRRSRRSSSSASLEAGPLPDGFSSVEASLATLRASIPWGDIGAAARACPSCGRARRAGVALATRRLRRPRRGPLLQRRVRRGRRWLAEPLELAPSHGQWRVASTSLAFRSWIAGDRGDGEDQMLLADQAA